MKYYEVNGGIMALDATAAPSDWLPDGWRELSGAEVSALLSPPQSPSEVLAACEAAVEAHQDAVAQSWGYKSADRLILYATSTNAVWAAEAVAFVAWRDVVVAQVNNLLNHHVANPGAELPTPESVVLSLPAIVRP